eukprot:TRINITY_DN601_c1_g1_i1.p1 TRINITY_DN601_c1_g1~~TRINITY_DN601_c1_g1_i1.p1  ORF type:complete len:164 (-),score=22.34 TRINITY_DN601_c1_g1_i1:532-1023(-)
MIKAVVFLAVALQAAVVAQDLNATCLCGDIPPPSNGSMFDCSDQAAWEKCSEGWMMGYCQCTCGTCDLAPLPEGEEEVTTVVEVFSEVAPGEPIEKDICDTRDEPENCAQSRERCCAGCGSSADVDFECNQIGSSFASSCSCASSGGSAIGRAISRFSRFFGN